MHVLMEQGKKTIVVVPAEMVHDMADALRLLIESAAVYGVGRYDADYFFNLCATRKAHLMIGVDDQKLMGCMITCSVVYPTYSALRIPIVSGYPGSLTAFLELAWRALAMWARSVGAERIEIWGRPQWKPAIRRVCNAEPEQSMYVASYIVNAA